MHIGKKITEQPSAFNQLETLSIKEILEGINGEDHKVAHAVERCIPDIQELTNAIFPNFSKKGRLFYVGAGTSGRLGILDASEIPPTYGMPHDKIIGMIAGGDGAIRKAVEFAEDNKDLAKCDLEQYDFNDQDALIGLAASGTTPYVVGALKYGNKVGAVTGCICCNIGTPVSQEAKFPIVVVVGPEFVTGSTRMKSGTAQKLILNMISTTLMIKIGRVQGNKMVHMQITNHKLIDRGIRFIMEETGIDRTQAKSLLDNHQSVKKALDAYYGQGTGHNRYLPKDGILRFF